MGNGTSARKHVYLYCTFINIHNLSILLYKGYIQCKIFLCSLRYCFKCYFSKGVYSFMLSTVYSLKIFAL